MQIEIAGPADEERLREAFRRVAEKNLAFCLLVSDGISERIFYFAIGGLRVIASGPRRSPSLVETLLERGSVTAEGVARAERAAGGDPARVADALVGTGICRPEAIQAAVVQQVEEELQDLFFWDGAEMQLVEGQPPKSFYEGKFQTAALTCDVNELLRSVSGRVDEWKVAASRLPGGRDVYEATDRAAPDLHGPFARLVRFLDGQHTVVDAIQSAKVRRVPAFVWLMEAIQQGKVRRTVGGAAQKVTRDELQKEIRQLETAVRERVDATIVRRRLARALEQVGEKPRAAAQWRALGDLARKGNDLDLALQCYGECVRVLPTDFATRELVIDIHRHRKDDAAVLQNGRPLADLFLKHNLLNRAKLLLLYLIGLDPTDLTLRRQLVVVLIGLGERDQALRHLRELARMLEGRGAPAGELKDVYLRILALEPRDSAARTRLDTLTGATLRRRVLRASVAGAAGVLAVLGGLFWVERSARADVNTALATARERVLVRDLDGARSVLEEVVEAHPIARARRSAEAFLARIEQFQREQREIAERKAALAVRRAVRTDSPERKQHAEAAAAQMARDAARLVEEHHVADAHRIYRELVTTLPHTEAAAAVRVPLSVSVLPRDARVIVGGKVVGTGDTQIDYAPGTPDVLEVEKDGFARVRVPIEGLQEPRLFVALHRPLRWSASFDAAIDGAPLVDGGAVFVAGRDRFVTALSAADGRTLWRTPLGLYGDAGVAPVATAGGILVATATGEVVMLDRATGEVRWRKGSGGAITRQPVVAGGAALVVSADGGVTAYDPATGDAAWTLPAASVAGSPVAMGTSEAAWIDARGTLQVVAAATGRPAPRMPTTAVLRGTPAVGDGDRLWVFAEDDSLRLLSAASGTALRRLTAPRALSDLPPFADGETVLTALSEGTVQAHRASGEVVFRKRIDQTASAGVTAANGRVYVGGDRGRLTVLDAATGDEIWRFETGSRVTARPVVAGGTVYVATARGRLLAFEE